MLAIPPNNDRGMVYAYGDSPAAAFERADKAVYHAKGAGRNQVQSHAALVAQGRMIESQQLSDVELF